MTKQEQIDELKRRIEELERRPAPVVVVPPIVVRPQPWRDPIWVGPACPGYGFHGYYQPTIWSGSVNC